MKTCASCGTENPDIARFCLACGSQLADAPAPQETRKVVTIVFSDLKGSTSLGEALDSEALREVMTRYFDAMRGELERHGGVIEKFIGDAVMAVFGLPRLHEDDALRAVRAAAGMQAALEALNVELERHYGVQLSNRTGVNTGEVVSGDPSTGQRLVTGDAVNVAARLEQAAGEREVLLGELTYRLVRDSVEVMEVEPLALKGKAEPVPAYQLVRVKESGDVELRRGAPLIGRAEELATLESIFDEAVTTRSARLVTLVADAGVGKSRLTAEFLEADLGAGVPPLRPVPALRRRHHVLAAGRGAEERVGDRQRRRRRGGAREAGRAHGRGRSGRHPASRRDDRPAAGAVLHGGALLGRCAGSWSTSRPTVPWRSSSRTSTGRRRRCSSSSSSSSRRSTTRRCWCSAPRGRCSSTTIRTGARDSGRRGSSWSRSAPRRADRWSRACSAAGRSTRRSSTVSSTAAEGNPLFAEQLLRMLVDEGVLERSNGSWRATGPISELHVPPTIQALLAARLDTLASGERSVIEPASVVGYVFADAAVSALAPPELSPRVGDASSRPSRRSTSSAASTTATRATTGSSTS